MTTMQIRSIRTSKKNRAALGRDREALARVQWDARVRYLDILVTLVETYEERRWPLRSRRRFDPVDVLRYAIEGQAELADILGSRSRASEVLARFGRLGPRMTDGRLPFRCQQRRWVPELPRY
jgi:HTH-type transcriptional regulator / antitoxin HigA